MVESFTYMMKIAYVGADYCGWQIQPQQESIQSLIEKYLSLILGKQTSIHGSGRTDAGVHAQGQVAHFVTDQSVNLYKLRRSLNGLLPPSIRILSVHQAPSAFHARFDAIGKEYHYRIGFMDVLPPFYREYVYHHKGEFSLELLKKGADRFVGTHDFTSVTNCGGSAQDHVRTIYSITPVLEAPGICCLKFYGNGFLYKMVRNIVGILIDVATQKIQPEEVTVILQSLDRRKGSKAAASIGLTLHRVFYKEEIEAIFQNDRESDQNQ